MIILIESYLKKMKKVKKIIVLLKFFVKNLRYEKKENMNNSKLKHFNPMISQREYSARTLRRGLILLVLLKATMIGIVVEVTSSLMMNNQSRKVLTTLVGLIVEAFQTLLLSLLMMVVFFVKFQSSDNSYTDGKAVVIGSKIDEKNFDPVVGLALHEGSHIKLSDFDVVRNLENNIPQELFVRRKSWFSEVGRCSTS